MGETSFNISDENLEQHIVTLFEKLECMRKESKASGNCEDLSGRIPARLELRTLSLWKAVVAECAASFLYVFIVCGAAGGAGVGASASAVLLTTALASGCAIATLTMCFAKISGAHVNPAVSAALCVRRLVSPLRAALYIAAQCGGGIAGAAAVYGVSVPGYAGSLSAALPGAGGGGGAAWERLGAELVLTALVAAAHGAARDRRWTGSAPALLGAAYTAASFVSLSERLNDATRDQNSGIYLAQRISIAIQRASMLGALPSGNGLEHLDYLYTLSGLQMPSLNPARSLGPSFVLSRWEAHWVCWVGGLGGGALAGLAREWCGRRPPSRASSRDLDDDKPAFSYRPTYCAAAPRPDTAEPLYSGTKSLYCRSPPPARHHTLHRSQSVYSKGSTVTSGATGVAGAGSLAAAQSLVLRPAHVQPHTHTLAHAQNAHNAQRDPPYSANGVRPGPAGAAVSERRESVYSSGGAGAGAGAGAVGARRMPEDAYGTYSRAPPYRPHPQEHY